MDTICPACGKGFLITEYDFNIIEYPNELLQLNCYYSICSNCGSELASPEQINFNTLISELGYMIHDNILNINELDEISKFIVNKCIRIIAKNNIKN